MKSLLLHKLKNILSKRMPPKWLRVLTLATLFMAGGGLDIKSLFNLSIPMSIFYLVLLIALVIKYVNVEIEEMLIALGVFMTMFIVYVFKGSMLDWWILPVILQGFVVLCFYKEIPNKFLGDLRCLCEIYMYYTIVGIALLFLLGGVFLLQVFSVIAIFFIYSFTLQEWVLEHFVLPVLGENLVYGKCFYRSIFYSHFMKKEVYGRFY